MILNNKLHFFYIILLVLCTNLFSQTEGKFTVPYGENAKVGKYANVNDIKMYYEIYG